MIDPAGSILAPPPRAIRPMLAAQMMLGGAESQAGWAFLGLGSFFFWLFVWHADLSGWRFQYAPVSRVRGEALGCGGTRFSEGGSRYRRGIPILQTRYRYRVQAEEFEGASYAAGRCVPSGEVTVEYLTRSPQIARIAGMRRQPLSAWAIIVTLFPGFGLVWVVVGMVRGRNRVRLLRQGLPAAGKLIEQVTAQRRSVGYKVYRLTFEYTAHSGVTGRVTSRSYMAHQLEKAARELVLYDPEDLTKAMVLATAPGKVVIDERGEPMAGGSAAFLILPALTILGNAWYALTLVRPG
jgi:hypothetical protein